MRRQAREQQGSKILGLADLGGPNSSSLGLADLGGPNSLGPADLGGPGTFQGLVFGVTTRGGASTGEDPAPPHSLAKAGGRREWGKGDLWGVREQNHTQLPRQPPPRVGNL